MWLDSDTNDDYLNFSETAEVVEAILREPTMLPVSVGVFGGWGTGKSTVLRLIAERLAPVDEERPKFVVVHFDAWLYQDFDDARAALMEAIGTALRDAAENNESWREKATKFLRRIDKFRLLVGAADVALALKTGGLTSGWLGGGYAALTKVLTGNGAEVDAAPIQGAAERLAATAAPIFTADDDTPAKQIGAFRSDFAEVMNAAGDCTLVVFIDNLDRCLPRTAIQTLEAIRLFLFLPKTAFVVAADEDMVRHSVKEHFGTSSDDRHVADYLDKLIQVPVRVPRLGEHEARTYMYHLFAEVSGLSTTARGDLRRFTEQHLRQSWKAEPFTKQAFLSVVDGPVPNALASDLDLADRLAPLLAKASRIDGNPRTIKRMLNSVRMRSKVARQRGMNLNDAVLAKLAVFERCTDQLATSALFNSISQSADGKSPLLRIVEADDFDPENPPAEFPESWKKPHLPFIRSWVLLDPRLSELDLRPAIYLSRETAVLHVSRGGLSPAAMDILRLLSKVPNTGLSVPTREAKRLAPAEADAVMNLLIDELRNTNDWTQRPTALNGAHTLAMAQPSTKERLLQFLEGMGAKPVWMKPLLRSLSPPTKEN